jgi:hypothetical protein
MRERERERERESNNSSSGSNRMCIDWWVWQEHIIPFP